MPVNIINLDAYRDSYEIRIYDKTTISRPTEDAALDNVMRQRGQRESDSLWVPHIEGLQLTGGRVLPSDNRPPEQLLSDYIDDDGLAVGIVDNATVYTDDAWAIVMHIYTVQMFPFVVTMGMVKDAQKAARKRGKRKTS